MLLWQKSVNRFSNGRVERSTAKPTSGVTRWILELRLPLESSSCYVFSSFSIRSLRNAIAGILYVQNCSARNFVQLEILQIRRPHMFQCCSVRSFEIANIALNPEIVTNKKLNSPIIQGMTLEACFEHLLLFLLQMRRVLPRKGHQNWKKIARDVGVFWLDLCWYIAIR